MINIANLSADFPIWIDKIEYSKLIIQKSKGWSNCHTQTEWMAKLHYLRAGYKSGKISKEDFFKKEKELVLNWWIKWT